MKKIIILLILAITAMGFVCTAPSSEIEYNNPNDPTGTGFVPPVTTITRPASIIHHWKLDDVTGTMTDATGNWNLTSMGLPTDVTGIFGTAKTGFGAATFIGDSITPSAWVPSPATPFSVEFWIMFGNVTGSVRTIFHNDDNILTPSNPVFCGLNGSGQLFCGDFSVNNVFTPPITSLANDGIWHYVVFTWDTTTGRLYLDGIEVGTPIIAISIFDALGFIRIGGHPFGNPCDGCTIDDVAVWNSAMTQGDITDRWNGGAGKEYVDP